MEKEGLLQGVSSIIRQYEQEERGRGAEFNLFEILDKMTDEVKICKVIYELISPRGSHGQKGTFLKLFLQDVIGKDYSKEQCDRAAVYREYVIAENRRIDLAIEMEDTFIPIEVKIYAEDQDRQCYDYYQYKKSNVYYLTLFGKAPSKESAAGLTIREEGEGYQEVIQISFENQITMWLSHCIEICERLKLTGIEEILKQFLRVVQKLTYQLGNGCEEKVCEIMMQSEENMRSALQIKSCIESCKQKMMIRVLQDLETYMEGLGLYTKIQESAYDYKQDQYQLVHEFDNKKASSMPGFSFALDSVEIGEKKTLDRWIRVEINYRLYIGICLELSHNSSQQEKEALKKQSYQYKQDADAYWVSKVQPWSYLPDGILEHAPNFKEYNEAYLALFDPNKYQLFIEQCKKKIDAFLALKH